MECHVTRRQIEPNPNYKVQECGCILRCFLIERDATGDVSGQGNCVFDICQKLFLGIKSRPGLENVGPRLGLRSQDGPYVRIESFRRSTFVCVKPSHFSRMMSRPRGNVVQCNQCVVYPMYRM